MIKSKFDVKRFGILLSIIVVAICVSSAKINSDNNAVISTMSVPVTNKVIVVDARTWRRRWRSSK